MSKPKIPTEKEIKELPVFASIAFAARCARRALSFFERLCPDASETFLQAVRNAVRVAENAEAAIAHETAQAAYDSAKTVNNRVQTCVAHAACYAARAADAYAFATTFYPEADISAYAVTHAVPEILRTVENAVALGEEFAYDIQTEICADFEYLRKAAVEQEWHADKRVPPEFFGDLWPTLSTVESSNEELLGNTVEESKDRRTVATLRSVWRHLQGFRTVRDATGGQVYEFIQWIMGSKDSRFDSSPRTRIVTDLKSPWDQPKILVGASNIEGSPWRLVAFDNAEGFRSVSSYADIVLFPHDEWIPSVLSAVLSGPLSNAYVATHAVAGQISIPTVMQIPLPHLNRDKKLQIKQLVQSLFVLSNQYSELFQMRADEVDVARMSEKYGIEVAVTYPKLRNDVEKKLLEIDRIVLAGYSLPPPLERDVINFFRGHRRPLPFDFPDYESRLIRLRLEDQTRLLDEDTDEQIQTWEVLKTSLDEDRLSNRKLFS